ncbi:MAG: chorismate synthase [Bacteroidales bacterium]|nr:chorismate synthase [Bacteroidales bacterium]
MAGNTFGTLFCLTTFGESHGPAIGGIIDGCPAGLEVDLNFVQECLDKRRPGQSGATSPRKESDLIEVLSGVFEGKTTGAPIAFMMRNQDHKPGDYDHLKDTFRPSHADFSWTAKYGFRDHRGGGRSSARETAARVAGGAFAQLLLNQTGTRIRAWVSSVGPIMLEKSISSLNLSNIEANTIRCPDVATAQQMLDYIEKLKAEGDTTGGIITCLVQGVPAGLGEPVFDKLQADLAKAMLSINAVKGFEYGSGFSGSAMKGSEHNDIIQKLLDEKTGKPSFTTRTNYSGGIQGGISTGEDIWFRVAFKPVATIMKDQQTLDSSGQLTTLEGKGRHDVCVVPRAVPIVEAMAALVLADHLLREKCSKI